MKKDNDSSNEEDDDKEERPIGNGALSVLHVKGPSRDIARGDFESKLDHSSSRSRDARFEPISLWLPCRFIF